MTALAGYDFLADGPAAMRIRALGGGESSLGAVGGWPDALKMLLGMMTRSRRPLLLWWGAARVQFHNDAFLACAALQDPDTMGRPAAEVWPALWPRIRDRVADAMDRGIATAHDAALLPLWRHDLRGEAGGSCGLTPVVDARGAVQGALVSFGTGAREPQDELDIADVMARTIDLMRVPAAGKRLRLGCETAGLPAALRGDPLRLAQILISLLANAVRCTDTGSVCLAAEVLERCDRRTLASFEVRDTGPGLSPARQAALFAPFEPADPPVAGRPGGAGRGLALSRQLARAMDGDAGVLSEPGIGSTFWFTAWFDDPPAASGAKRRYGAAGREGGAAALEVAPTARRVRERHAGCRVLLAEDNPVNREVGVALLESAGLAADTAADGDRALALGRAGRYDLILMDVQMPGLDGLGATRALRAERLAMPIIAMTASASAADRAACVAAGMDDHLAKPVDAGRLYAVLSKWLPPR